MGGSFSTLQRTQNARRHNDVGYDDDTWRQRCPGRRVNVLRHLDFWATWLVTKQERIKLAKAVQLFMDDDPDLWNDAMIILCRLLNPEWKPAAAAAAITIQEWLNWDQENA